MYSNSRNTIKNFRCVAISLLLFLSCKGYSQDDKNNAIAIGTLFLPGENSECAWIFKSEIERYIKRTSGRKSLVWRIQFIKYRDPSADRFSPMYNILETEAGKGFGLGFSYRHFHHTPYGRFFIESSIDFVNLDNRINYNADTIATNSYQNIILMPGVATGYRLISKRQFFLTAQILLGYKVDLEALLAFSGGPHKERIGPSLGAGIIYSFRY